MRKKTLYPLLIGLFVFFVFLILNNYGIFNNVELKCTDYKLALRSLINPENVKVSPDICIIGIDDNTFAKNSKPLICWMPEFTLIIKNLNTGGAKVIGFDYFPSLEVDKYITDGQNNTRDFALSILEAQGKVILISSFDEKNLKVKRPSPETISMACGFENIGVANLSRDSDGIMRAQTAGFIDKDSAFNPSFALLIASKYLGEKIEIPDENTLTIGRIKVPLVNSQIILNYQGPPYNGKFRYYSFEDLLQNAKQNNNSYFEKNFRGKVVLIGFTASDTGDIFDTPYNVFNYKNMPGIEVHANIINTIITGNTIKTANFKSNFLVFLIIVLISSFLLSLLRNPFVSIVLSIFIGIIYTIINYFVFIKYNLLLNLSTPLLSLPFLWGGIYAWKYIFEESANRKIKNIFGKYVSNEVMKELLKDPDKILLGGTMKTVTILFSDINGFTKRCENLDPQGVIEMLNRYLEQATAIIHENKGTINKFVGDEIMAIYGAPNDLENHAELAVKSAVETNKILEKIKTADPLQENDFNSVKFGIHTGIVVAGNIGGEKRLEYTIIGDNVNLASRIMGLNKQFNSSILISEDTYNLVKDKLQNIEFINKGEVEIRGRETKINIYEVKPIKLDAEIQPRADTASLLINLRSGTSSA